MPNDPFSVWQAAECADQMHNTAAYFTLIIIINWLKKIIFIAPSVV